MLYTGVANTGGGGTGSQFLPSPGATNGGSGIVSNKIQIPKLIWYLQTTTN